MTKRNNRLRASIAVICIALLLAVIGYMLWRTDASGASASSELAAVAADDAKKALAAAGMNSDDRAATEAVVRAYILENPEVVTDAIAILQQRDVAGRLSSNKAAITKAFYAAVAGNPSGDVTIVEFTDYNCGYCRSSVADVAKLIAQDRGIRLIYRELPILSATSRDAALWALAAAKQGKHGAFHSAMFAGGRPDAATIRAAATRAGLDLTAASKFASSAEANKEVDNNLAIMQQVGFNGTPTFVIGDQLLEGAVGYDALKAAVDKARKQG